MYKYKSYFLSVQAIFEFETLFPPLHAVIWTSKQTNALIDLWYVSIYIVANIKWIHVHVNGQTNTLIGLLWHVCSWDNIRWLNHCYNIPVAFFLDCMYTRHCIIYVSTYTCSGPASLVVEPVPDSNPSGTEHSQQVGTVSAGLGQGAGATAFTPAALQQALASALSSGSGAGSPQLPAPPPPPPPTAQVCECMCVHAEPTIAVLDPSPDKIQTKLQDNNAQFRKNSNTFPNHFQMLL